MPAQMQRIRIFTRSPSNRVAYGRKAGKLMYVQDERNDFIVSQFHNNLRSYQLRQHALHIERHLAPCVASRRLGGKRNEGCTNVDVYCTRLRLRLRAPSPAPISIRSIHMFENSLLICHFGIRGSGKIGLCLYAATGTWFGNRPPSLTSSPPASYSPSCSCGGGLVLVGL